MTDYGPPTPPKPWPTVTIGHPASRYGEQVAYQPRELVQQRRTINAIAYLSPDPLLDEWQTLALDTDLGCCLRVDPAACRGCPVFQAVKAQS